MGTPLFTGVVEEKVGRRVSITLELFDHQNFARFGTDRAFAWELLAFWLGIDVVDARAEAKTKVRSVRWALASGRITEMGTNWFAVEPEALDDDEPAVGYEIEVYDAALLENLAEGDDCELAMFPVEGAALENDAPAAEAPPPAFIEHAWVALRHRDGRQWAARLSRQGYELRIRAGPKDDSTVRERRSANPQGEIERLVAELLAEGWTRADGDDQF